MPINLTETATFITPVVGPAAADARNSASVRDPFQQLTSRTAYLRARDVSAQCANWQSRAVAAGQDISAIASRPLPSALAGTVPQWAADQVLVVRRLTVSQDQIQGSADGVTWSNSHTSLTIPDVNGIAYFGAVDRWIAVGSGGEIAQRSAGSLATAWATAHGPAGGDYYAVACGPSRAVAVGAAGRISHSTDGLIWTNTTLGSNNFGGIAYGGGLFCAVADGIAWTSPDGLTWTSRLTITEGVAPIRSRVAFDATRSRFFFTYNSPSGAQRLSRLDTAAPATVTTISIGQSTRDLACLDGVLVLSHGGHVIRHSHDGGVSFTGTRVALPWPGSTLTAIHGAEALGSFLIGGTDLTNGILYQSARSA